MPRNQIVKLSERYNKGAVIFCKNVLQKGQIILQITHEARSVLTEGNP
jgi:hypothetical protein